MFLKVSSNKLFISFFIIFSSSPNDWPLCELAFTESKVHS